MVPSLFWKLFTSIFLRSGFAPVAVETGITISGERSGHKVVYGEG